MTKKFIYLFTAIIALNGAVLFAQETTTVAEGTLTLGKKTFPLSHAVAYELATADEEGFAIVLTAQPVSSEKLKKEVAAEKGGGPFDFPSPYLRLIFKKAGKFKRWSAVGGGTTVSGSRDGTGEFALQDGRVVGKATAVVDPAGMIRKGFDVRFDVALHKEGDELPVSTAKKGGPAANVKSTVTGTFTGNGKEAKLAYVSARWIEPFDGKTGISLVFTEKDHSKEKKPDNGAMFGNFGDALIISVHEDGSIYGCQVVHDAMKHKGFSSIGSIEATPFTYADGKVEGELTTNGAVDTFDEKWAVKLKFVAPLGEIPKEYQVAEESKTEKPAAKESGKVSGENDGAIPTKANDKASQPVAAGPKGKDVALTKDATEIKYVALVGQIDFQSKLEVKAACADLSANLKSQGWAKDGSDLITANSSILIRKQGSAKLTIFVKPDASGSQIKMMTRGLSWTE